MDLFKQIPASLFYMSKIPNLNIINTAIREN